MKSQIKENLEFKIDKGIMYVPQKGHYRITKCIETKQRARDYPTHIIEITSCDYQGKLTNTIPIQFEAKTDFDMDADIENNINFSTLDKTYHTDNFTPDFLIKIDSNNNHIYEASKLKEYIIKHAQYNQDNTRNTEYHPKFDLPPLSHTFDQYTWKPKI